MSKQAKRYVVEWTPWSEVRAAAVKNGMPEGGEVSDYVAIENFAHERTFPSFGLAVRFARAVIEADTWHCPRIYRQVLVQNDHDDLGRRVKPMPSFETDATWEVFADEPDPTEAAPHWLDEAA